MAFEPVTTEMTMQKAMKAALPLCAALCALTLAACPANDGASTDDPGTAVEATSQSPETDG